ncbi:MAG: 50S ribosomal protein L3, partial [Gemmatimonadota bacterium]|nr:50S ribosomal protein L3 [Gemmatimonadota bacterium]
MANGLIGRKLGMARVFAEDGTSIPVTVIEAGPCRVVQVKDGAVQLGYGTKAPQRSSKAELGHAKAATLEAAPHILRDFGTGEAS